MYFQILNKDDDLLRNYKCVNDVHVLKTDFRKIDLSLLQLNLFLNFYMMDVAFEKLSYQLTIQI